MSEVQKNIEEPTAVTAVTEAPAITEPVTEVKPTEPTAETTSAVPATTEDVKPVEEATPAAEEVKPVEEGVLGYKGPGLLKYVPLYFIILSSLAARDFWVQPACVI